MDLREVRFLGTQWTRLALDGVQFLENLETAKNFYYEKVKVHFLTMWVTINFQE